MDTQKILYKRLGGTEQMKEHIEKVYKFYSKLKSSLSTESTFEESFEKYCKEKQLNPKEFNKLNSFRVLGTENLDDGHLQNFILIVLCHSDLRKFNRSKLDPVLANYDYLRITNGSFKLNADQLDELTRNQDMPINSKILNHNRYLTLEQNKSYKIYSIQEHLVNIETKLLFPLYPDPTIKAIAESILELKLPSQNDTPKIKNFDNLDSIENIYFSEHNLRSYEEIKSKMMNFIEQANSANEIECKWEILKEQTNNRLKQDKIITEIPPSKTVQILFNYDASDFITHFNTNLNNNQNTVLILFGDFVAYDPTSFLLLLMLCLCKLKFPNMIHFVLASNLLHKELKEQKDSRYWCTSKTPSEQHFHIRVVSKGVYCSSIDDNQSHFFFGGFPDILCFYHPGNENLGLRDLQQQILQNFQYQDQLNPLKGINFIDRDYFEEFSKKDFCNQILSKLNFYCLYITNKSERVLYHGGKFTPYQDLFTEFIDLKEGTTSRKELNCSPVYKSVPETTNDKDKNAKYRLDVLRMMLENQ